MRHYNQTTCKNGRKTGNARHETHRSCLIVTFLISSFFVFHSSFSSAATPAAVTPYTFLGRVMDARHVGFDTNRVAKIAAADAAGKLLVETKTFYRPNTRMNYVLDIPMATSAAEGFAVQNTLLQVWATDDVGKVWNGVIANSYAGAPGAVREVDIVLGVDDNGDGIDDSLYLQLLAQWEASDYWKRGETFDPNKDYDGDGVSTINEALAGTDPFNARDVLTITAITQLGSVGTRNETGDGTKPVALSFTAFGGHTYTVEEATDLMKKDWKAREFQIESGELADTVSLPSSARRTTYTVYLLPTTSTNAFFRIKSK